MRKALDVVLAVGLGCLAACGDIGLSAGPAGDGNTTATTGTAGTTTSSTTGSTTSTTGSSTSSTTSSTTGSTTSSTTGSTTSSTCAETYASFGQTFIANNCISCHGSGTQYDLSTLAAVTALQTQALSQIQSGAMPLGGTLSTSDKTNAETWLACNPLP